MGRQAVKLLLVDPEGMVLLVQSRDPATAGSFWYPVGGGLEPGETPYQAARREAWEETGLVDLPAGTQVWSRDATYTHGGRTYDVHEQWWHFVIDHFDPEPGRLTDSERESITGFRWWSHDELRGSRDTVFPPDLADRLADLQENGLPAAPIDIG